VNWTTFDLLGVGPRGTLEGVECVARGVWALLYGGKMISTRNSNHKPKHTT